MLCIAMKEGAIVRIGDDIDIFVQHVGGGQVRLSLSVPKEIAVRHLAPESVEGGRAERARAEGKRSDRGRAEPGRPARRRHGA